MKIVDANVLLYAVNESAEHHHEAVGWLDAALNGRSTVGFSWISLLAFLRLSTKIGLFPSPLTVDQALDRVHAWLARPASLSTHRIGDGSGLNQYHWSYDHPVPPRPSRHRRQLQRRRPSPAVTARHRIPT